jgi:hypothetical protein
MSRTMIAEFDGYLVAERLLEGVMFQVHLKEQDGDVVLVKVTDPPDAVGYLANIRSENYRAEISERIEGDLEHLRKEAKSEGKTLVQLFDEWEAQGYDRASLVTEV